MKKKKSNINLFIKLNIHIFKDKGLLHYLTPEELQTLIGLALFLPNINPSESYLSKILGISQTSVSKRIRDLEMIPIEGKPLLKVKRLKLSNGKFSKNEYQLNPNCGLSIFGNPTSGNQNTVLSPSNTDEPETDVINIAGVNKKNIYE